MEERVLHHPDMMNPLGDPQPEADETPTPQARPSVAPEAEDDLDDLEDTQDTDDSVDDEDEASPATSEPTFTRAEVELMERTARAEEGARAAREHAAFVQEQLQLQRSTATEPEPPHPLVEALEAAGVDKTLLDDYLDRRQELFLQSLGNQVEQQNQAVVAAHQGVKEIYPDFEEAKLNAWMIDHPDEARVIETMRDRDLQAGLAAGWAMMGATAGSDGEASPPRPAVTPKPRTGVRDAAVSSARQKIASKSPATTWAEMSPAERQAFMKRLDAAPDGSELQKKLLRIRMPSTDARVQAHRGQYAFRREDY